VLLAPSATMVAAPAGADVKMKMAARIDRKPGTPNRQLRDFMLAPNEH
jgi:hypothetical protein